MKKDKMVEELKEKMLRGYQNGDNPEDLADKAVEHLLSKGYSMAEAAMLVRHATKDMLLERIIGELDAVAGGQ